MRRVLGALGSVKETFTSFSFLLCILFLKFDPK